MVRAGVLGVQFVSYQENIDTTTPLSADDLTATAYLKTASGLYFGSNHYFRIYGLPMIFVGGYQRFQY